MMHGTMGAGEFDVFLSYSSVDRDWVAHLADRLRDWRIAGRSLTVFLDSREIVPGANIVARVEDALSRTRCLGVVISPESSASPWVALERSAAVISGKVRVLPLLLRGSEADIPALLRAVRYIDFRHPARFESALAELVHAVTETVPPPSRQPVRPPEGDARPTEQLLDLLGRWTPRLIGRDTEVEELLAALQEPEPPVLVVSGLGGIGKTSLATHVVAECERRGMFDFIHRATGMAEILLGGKIVPVGSDAFSLSAFLKDLASRVMLLKGSPVDAAPASIAAELAGRRALIFIDNMETAEDLPAFITAVTGLGARILVTSRVSLADVQGVREIRLRGLASADSLQLLRHEAALRRIGGGLLDAGREIVDVCRITGGAPLALKLVVGLLTRLPLDEVIRELEAAGGASTDFYAFVFRRSWTLISQDARAILLALCALEGSFRAAVVGHLSGLEGTALYAAVAELLTFSLLDASSDLASANRQYSLHPLTINFLKSSLPAEWLSRR